jgi:hypothetical protein
MFEISFKISSDAPPNSLKNSNVNPKVKMMEKGVGACSLTRNAFGGKRDVLELRDED